MAEQHPWTAVPAKRMSAPILAKRMRLLIGVVAFAALAGPLAFLMQLTEKPPVIPPANGPALYEASFAQIVAEDFLAGRTTTVPLAKGIEANFGNRAAAPFAYETISLSYTLPRTVAGKQFTTAVFRVKTPTALYDLAVPVGLDSASRPFLAANPTLEPVSAASKDETQIGFPSYFVEYKPVPGALQPVLNKWAAAYAASDGDALRQIANDTTNSGTYIGLGEFHVAQNPQPLAAVYDPDAVGVIVRVRVGFASNAATDFVVTNEFDLLVTEIVDSAVPKIVAWGPAGSGPTLTPLANRRAA